MIEAHMTCSLWPVRFKPLDDELLTSWLARLAAAHGLSLQRFYSIAVLRKTLTRNIRIFDLDSHIPPNMLSIIASKTVIPIQRVNSTTLASYEGTLFEKMYSGKSLPWLTPGIHRYNQERPGLQLCPQCLAEDKEPYYRRSWRLAFVVLCIKHRRHLLDRCPKCYSPINFIKGVCSEDDFPIYSMASCYTCRFDLQYTKSSSRRQITRADITFQKLLVDAANTSWIDIPSRGTSYAILYFLVLRQLMVLLGSNTRFRERVNESYGIDDVGDKFQIGGHKELVEGLDVYERLSLIRTTRALFTDWPSGFIDICRSLGLRNKYLFRNMHHIPFWFWSVVNEHLTQERYITTDEEIKSAYECINRRKSWQHHRTCDYPKDLQGVVNFLREHRYRMKNILSDENGEMLETRNINYLLLLKGTNVLAKPPQIPGALWVKVKALLPVSEIISKGTGSRKLLNGMLYYYGTSCYWSEIPAKFGSPTAIYSRYSKWRRLGIWDKIWEHCAQLF